MFVIRAVKLTWHSEVQLVKNREDPMREDSKHQRKRFQLGKVIIGGEVGRRC